MLSFQLRLTLTSFFCCRPLRRAASMLEKSRLGSGSCGMLWSVSSTWGGVREKGRGRNKMRTELSLRLYRCWRGYYFLLWLPGKHDNGSFHSDLFSSFVHFILCFYINNQNSLLSSTACSHSINDLKRTQNQIMTTLFQLEYK